MGRSSKRKRKRRSGGASTPPSVPQMWGARFAPATKLSEALATLIEPYREEANTLHAYNALAAMGTLAWNLSFDSPSQRNVNIEEAILKVAPPDVLSFREVLSSLLSRKERLFPDDDRLIFGYEVIATSAGFHLTVASVRVGK